MSSAAIGDFRAMLQKPTFGEVLQHRGRTPLLVNLARDETWPEKPARPVRCGSPDPLRRSGVKGTFHAGFRSSKHGRVGLSICACTLAPFPPSVLANNGLQLTLLRCAPQHG